VKQSFEGAEDHFLAATKQGSAKAWFDLGVLHPGSLGFAEKVRPKEAVLHLEKAFADGYVDAGRLLVKLLQEGTRVPKNEARAFEILTTAAGKGNSDARFAIGEAYEKGLASPRIRPRRWRPFSRPPKPGILPRKQRWGCSTSPEPGEPRRISMKRRSGSNRGVEKGFSRPPSIWPCSWMRPPRARQPEERRAVELFGCCRRIGIDGCAGPAGKLVPGWQTRGA